MEGPGNVIAFPGNWRGRPAQEAGSTNSFVCPDDTPLHGWMKPWQGEVVFYFYWDGWASTVPIESVAVANRIITLQHGGYQFDVPPWYEPVSCREGSRFRVENLFEALTEPGEWCLDTDDGKNESSALSRANATGACPSPRTAAWCG